ncbi:hypothetical protein C8R46DRAFT_1208816 [Mycena filopes]|nr:hypothetical protein C8R46DRAFT_1208816 [Mycena filopes]
MLGARNETTPDPILLANPITALGPGFLGNAFNWLLMGTLMMQVYTYWRHYALDKRIIKALVYTIFVMELVQTAFATHESWWYAIQNWGNVASLQTAPWTTLVRPIMCGIISTMVQLLYAFRIWSLNRTVVFRVLVAFIVTLALMQGIAAIAASGLLVNEGLSQPTLLRLHPVFVLWLVGSFVTDLVIAGSMLWILQASKTQTFITETNSLLNRLILNTIRTGSATVICAGIGMALFVKYTDKNSYYVFTYTLGKVYSNSFMASLNSRQYRRRPSQDPQGWAGGAVQLQMTSDVQFAPKRSIAAQECNVHRWPRSQTDTSPDSKAIGMDGWPLSSTANV